MLRRLMSLFFIVTAAASILYPAHAADICLAPRASSVPSVHRVADLLNRETRFGYFGFRHDSLHERGIIDAILSQTKSACCGGADSGECRVSLVDFVNHRIYVDGRWCAMGTPKIAIVEGLADDEPAVVCAAHLKTPGECSVAFCLGVRSGF